MNYRHYSAEDFLLDRDFRNWVEHPSEESDLFWNEYIKQHPEKAGEIHQAKDILQRIAFKKHRLSSHESEALWSEILQDIGSPIPQQKPEGQRELRSSPVTPVRSVRITARRMMLPAAGVALLLMFASAVLWLAIRQREQVYATNYGETREVLLPDGSVATLNAHSILRVPTDWSEQPAREVWLEGEAFFQVQEVSQNDNLNARMPVKFVVHTQGVAVEVLGTKFNVNTRREKVQVVLNSGKVKLSWQEQEVMMKPGELVEVSRAGEEVSQKLVTPETYSSWKDNHLVCDATPLYELATTIEDRFGYQLIIQDESLKTIKVSGTIPLDDIETFNLVISRLVAASFKLEGNRVYISK